MQTEIHVVCFEQHHQKKECKKNHLCHFNSFILFKFKLIFSLPVSLSEVNNSTSYIPLRLQDCFDCLQIEQYSLQGLQSVAGQLSSSDA